jgi:hypothetical protein
MKLSEALKLKAQWWMLRSPEDQEVEDILDGSNMFMKTVYHIQDNYPEHVKHATNEQRAYICLLESELQKDEEALNHLNDKCYFV